MLSDYDIYFKKVWGAMDALSVRAEFDLNKMVRAENRAEFIEIVKLYIDTDQGKEDGVYLEFSNDYGRIRKFKKVILTPKNQTK